MFVGAGSTQDVCKTIIKCIQDTDACDEFDPFDICNESVLSVRPYKEILENHFGDLSMKAPNIPIISKSYEEMYMREPCDTGERQCVMGEKCECKLMDALNGFIAVEFTLPGEVHTGPRQMCVICHRRYVQSLFYDMLYASSPYRGVIQKYGNICGHTNEYSKEVALVCPPGGPVQCMPYPSIRHQRSKYCFTTIHGIKYVKQMNMQHEDF